MKAKTRASAALSVVAACSSGGHATRPTVSGVKAAYVRQADAVCRTYNDQIAAVPYGNDPASREAGKHAVTLLGREIADLRALPAPPRDRSTLEPIWDGMDAALQDLLRTGPHPDIRTAVGQAVGQYIGRLQAYGTC